MGRQEKEILEWEWSRDRDLNPGGRDLQSLASPLGYPGIEPKEAMAPRRGFEPLWAPPTGLAGRRPTRLGYRGTFELYEPERVFKLLGFQ